jgi:GT2 family glycosyltransferase
MYAEELDFCYRAAKAGWRIKYVPILSVLHYKDSDAPQRQMSKYVYSRSNLVLFQKKHFGLLPALLLAAFILISNLFRVVFWTCQHKPGPERSLYGIKLLGVLLPELAETLKDP